VQVQFPDVTAFMRNASAVLAMKAAVASWTNSSFVSASMVTLTFGPYGSMRRLSSDIDRRLTDLVSVSYTIQLPSTVNAVQAATYVQQVTNTTATTVVCQQLQLVGYNCKDIAVQGAPSAQVTYASTTAPVGFESKPSSGSASTGLSALISLLFATLLINSVVGR